MGLGIGFPCCDCGGTWFVRVGQMHQYYQPWEVDREFEIAGSDDGFELTNDAYSIKLERTTGDNWLLSLVLLPLGRISSIAVLGEDFAAPFDHLFSLPGNDVLQGVISIVRATTAPAEFTWFPNRVDYPDDIKYHRRHTGDDVFPGYPAGFVEEKDFEDVILTRSEDSDYVYWSGTAATVTPFPEPINLRAGKVAGNLEYNLGSFWTAIGNIIRPFTPLSTPHQFHDSTNERVYEQLNWSELMLPELTRTTKIWDVQTGQPNNYPNGVRLFADLLLADDPLFDDSLVSAGRTIERQWVYMLPVYDQVKVALQIKWSSSFSIETSSVSILDIDSDGRFSGTVNVSSVPAAVTISGRVLNNSQPSALWPVSGEELASQTMSPKIWLPEQFERLRQTADSGYDWTIQTGLSPTQILGHINFINTSSLASKVAIDSGSLPAGMSFSIGGFANPANRITISGIPTTPGTGSVRFKITDTTVDASGSPIDYVYKSKTYSWKIE